MQWNVAWRNATGHCWNERTPCKHQLAILKQDRMADVVPGGAGEHGCHYEVCRCYDWGITDRGRAYLGTK